MSTTPPSSSVAGRGLIVDANYRFIAAYQEVNARIAQRQQALGLYVSLTLGLLAVLVALRPDAGRPALPVEWLALGFPVTSATLVFLNYKAERALSNLRRFLSQLERLNDAHLALPSYNTDPHWTASANRARRYHDYASATLVATANALALATILGVHPDRITGSTVAVWLIAVVAILATLALALMPRLSYRPGRDTD
ncbi:hypothetical protein CJ010_11055 [Azoarcus sp. DD4]|uniref:hypothetical protein n=1 Tax=Azoarcus sp. DD4 TaxID=2027405 RepID=UPI0011271742|nr:hypothetical protein [Azoarcus sp. DD4]QDF97023.1 hypothetical protein CJ010_11055 [Azoarcus sp. DD4]